MVAIFADPWYRYSYCVYWFINPWQSSTNVKFVFLEQPHFFIIASIPVFTEVGTSAKIAGKALKVWEKVGTQQKEKQPAFDRGARITYLFGLAGISTFILAFLALGIG